MKIELEISDPKFKVGDVVFEGGLRSELVQMLDALQAQAVHMMSDAAATEHQQSWWAVHATMLGQAIKVASEIELAVLGEGGVEGLMAAKKAAKKSMRLVTYEERRRYAVDVSDVPDKIRRYADDLEAAIDADYKDGIRSAASGLNELCELLYAHTDRRSGA